MQFKKIIFEAPALRDKCYILACLRKGHQVYVVEPFHAYHHRGDIRFFPPRLPDFVLDLIKQGRISLITADQLDARQFNAEATEKAVAAVEVVYPFYKDKLFQLISFTSSKLGSGIEVAFKKSLCDRLGDFFAMNMLLERLAVLFEEPVTVFPHTNIYLYEFYFKLVADSGVEYHKHENIRFTSRLRKRARNANLISAVKLAGKLFAQSFVSLLWRPFMRSGKGPIKRYRYAFTVVAPKRQFRGNQRGVDFLVDGERILPSEVVYLPLVGLNREQNDYLRTLGSGVVTLPRQGRFFSNWREWEKLARLTWLNSGKAPCDAFEVAALSFFTAFRWQHVLKRVSFDNFITHSDFGVSHIGRNLEFRGRGIATWYYSDSCNMGKNFRVNNVTWNRHPFWTYLNYDHLVTWNQDMVDYFSLHPGSFQKLHVVGCLWSSHVNHVADRAGFLKDYFAGQEIPGKFVIVVYTSTYSVNGPTSYEDGIAFARAMEKLVEDFDDILVLVKEKKEPHMHLRYDPVKGRDLLAQYERMDRHPRIKIGSNKLDVSLLMAVADLCVSFPFTSTTNEALGAQRFAIWHDPMKYYRETPYAKYGGLVTHGYEELKEKVSELKNMAPGSYEDPIKEKSSLFDPYRDGKAIERFRRLLTESNGH